MFKKQTSARRRAAKSPLSDHPFWRKLRRALGFSQRFSEFLHWLHDAPTSPKKRRHNVLAPLFQQLEAREMLYGGISANNDAYNAVNTSALNITAPGVLANDIDTGGYQMTAHLSAGPSHGTVTLYGDGGFIYTATAGFDGPDSFTYYDTDTQNNTSGTATVSLTVQFGALSAVDQTKLPADSLRLPMQILGSSSGQPATAANLSLVYNSSTAQPVQTLEEDFQPSMEPAVSATLAITDTFNGAPQTTSYVSTGNLAGNNPVIRLSQQVSTASLATGRYADSQSVSQIDSNGQRPLSTINGAANVVNDQNSPFGAGWEMPGLYHVYQNSASGVPAGVLLTDGGQGYYFTQGAGNAYTSPAGPYAFDTLTSVTGGGWQLVNRFGTTDLFNSSGDLTSAELANTQTTTYDWTNGLLTSIVDPFSRAVNLGYTSGLLSSITNYAGSVWSIAHSAGDLSSITEPDPGGGSPVWSFGYSGTLITSVSDPNSNATDYAFNSYGALSGDTLPGGSGQSYGGEQNYGYGSANQNSPTNAVLSSTVENSSTDPNGNTSYFTTDQFGDLTSSTDTYGNVTTWQRDMNGLVTQLTEPPPTAGAAAPVTNYSYDTLGNETSATGAHPTYGTYVFNGFSEWTSFTNSQNYEWTRSFDSHGNLLSEIDPLQNTVSYTVDSLGYPLTMTRPAPNDATGTVTTTYTRDSYERLTKLTWPDNTFQSFAYDTLDRQTSFTDENNHMVATNYDVLGRVTSVVNALNGTVSTTYDRDGNVLTTQDEMGNVTTNVWNGRNELTQQTLPVPAVGQPAPVWAWTYDANGNKLTETDPLGRVTSWTWDKLSRMTQETLPDPDGPGPLTSPVITIGYDNLSRKTSEVNALGGTTLWAYANTDVSQLTSMTLPAPAPGQASPVWTYSYNTLGQRYQTTDPLNHVQTTSFDADGNTLSVLDNLGHGPTYTYGHGGELLTTTDSLSHTTSDQYDSRYRLIQTTAADGGVTQITLDAAGNRVKLVDPANNQTSWTVDALNRPVTETNSLGTTTTSYDASSDVTSITDADGRVRNFAYDNLHRLIAENWMSGNTIVAAMAYAYDGASQLTSASDPNSAYAFGYNNDSQVLSVDNAGTPNVPHVVLTSTVDAMGDRTSLSATIAGTADFLNSYSYDADQRLTMVQQQQQTGGNTVAPKEIDYAYNSLGQFTDMAYYNYIGTGPRTDVATGTYSYDTANRLTGLAYTSNGGASTIDTFGWAYNAGNLVTSFTSSDGTASYGYDPTNQLTSATYTTNTGGHQPANESYSFDKNGNRTMTGYSTGSANLLTSDGTFNYTHDADGNQTVRTRISNSYATDYRTTYAWDYRNRLTDVEFYDNNSVLTKHVHYVYDVFNHLLATEADTTGNGSYNEVEHYVLDVSPQAPKAGVPGTVPAEPVLKFDANANLTDRVFEALGRIFAEGSVSSPTQADTPSWMLANNEGSVCYVLNNVSSVIDKIVYDPFGNVAYESNAAIAHFGGYASGHVDPFTGLIDEYERWYDPIDAKWLSNDPAGFTAGDADPSRYAGNNPTGRIDPSGLYSGPNLYWYYLTHPTKQDTDIQVAQGIALGAAAVAAAGLIAIAAASMAGATAAAIASTSVTVSAPTIALPTITATGAIGMVTVGGFPILTISGADIAVVAAGSMLIHAAWLGAFNSALSQANSGEGEGEHPDYSQDPSVLEAQQLQQELNGLIEEQASALEGGDFDEAQWIQAAIEWTQQQLQDQFNSNVGNEE